MNKNTIVFTAAVSISITGTMTKSLNMPKKYSYLSLDDVKAMRPLYSGLRKTINIGTFLGTKIPIPPRDEQDQIVRFLDWKVSSVNRLINIKRKEIKTIGAMKHSMVSNAVTRGLNPYVPMKFSGVKWLGDIPAHWQTIKLRQLLHPVSVKNHPELPLLSVVREHKYRRM